MFSDRILSCRDCGKPFVFSERAQAFLVGRGATSSPSRCPECRALQRARRQPKAPSPDSQANVGSQP